MMGERVPVGQQGSVARREGCWREGGEVRGLRATLPPYPSPPAGTENRAFTRAEVLEVPGTWRWVEVGEGEEALTRDVTTQTPNATIK